MLLPTDKGKALITVMPEEIQSADMTADWETKLLQIERGEMEPNEFMIEINTMISSLVKTTEAAKGANALMKNKIIGVCPNCGANVVERSFKPMFRIMYISYFAINCKVYLYYYSRRRQFPT